MKKITIDPMTRISGLLKIEVDIDNNKVVDAKASGNQFRGFEKMYKGRNPLDIIYLTSRLCGICSTHHSLTSTLALENAMNVTPNINGVLARDIANGFEFLQNHIRQIYFFALPDFVHSPSINPLFLTVSDKVANYRVPKKETERINQNYSEAIKYSREAHRAVAIITGKAPHGHGIYIGGTTVNMDIPQITALKFTIKEIKSFIENKMLEDINTVAYYYKDYFNMGKGYGNFMDFGVFNNYNDSSIRYSIPATQINGKKDKVDFNLIKESLYSSWLESKEEYITPGVSEPPAPNTNKNTGYSWVTAPRYNGYALEGGPLARMTINGYYKNGISAMDRLVARVLEAKKICDSVEILIEMLEISNAVQKEWIIPKEAHGMGSTGAARGCLAHWIDIKEGVVDNYTVIPPSNWNLSPMDNKGIKGPVEYALIGTNIDDIKNPVEIGRIVRSFDPCLNCAAHITTKQYHPIEINIL